MRSVIAPLPFFAHSGQSDATGASNWSSPRVTSMCAQSAVAPLVHDQTTPIVSRSHARPAAGSALPPQRSITVSPSRVTQTDAPTSSRSAKLRSKASRTPSNRGSHVLPWLIPRWNHLLAARTSEPADRVAVVARRYLANASRPPESNAMPAPYARASDRSPTRGAAGAPTPPQGPDPRPTPTPPT